MKSGGLIDPFTSVNRLVCAHSVSEGINRIARIAMGRITSTVAPTAAGGGFG
jgi:hypothetical protein